MRRVAVATSGGRDSTALLHCTLRAALPLGVQVWALHVHHGLQPQADDWLARVRAQSRRWGAAFDHRRLAGRPAAGDSVEAWARRERYRALLEMAQAAGCGLVLLAHHRRDQAETFLLQALRGGGPAGLSAMPRAAQRSGLTWARPWLDLPGASIEAYVQRHRLSHVHDPSNDDPRYARSRLRVQLWPTLLRAFPDAETALSGAATQAAHAAALAAEVAELDLAPLRHGDALDTVAWLLLPEARRRNALQAWLAAQLGAPPPASLVDRLMLELPRRSVGQWPAPQARLSLYRGRLQRVDPTPTVAPDACDAMALDLSRPGAIVLPQWHGRLDVKAVMQGGAPPALLQALAARARSGGERFALAPRADARSLKKQYQARAVPSWARQGPLLFTPQGRLLFAPGLGIDAGAWAPAGQPQLGIEWLPDPPQATGRGRTDR